MEFRHELKYEISYMDMLLIRQRLLAVASMDQNAVDGSYIIRSLYFDNLRDKALLEKIDGVNKREKFRLRYYNYDDSYIQLEKKSKVNGLCSKESADISRREVEMLLEGELSWMMDSDRGLIQELYSKMMSQQLRPKTIVDYKREPFVFAPGNVRVTLDHEIKTGMRGTDFLNPHCHMIPVRGAPVILEVKWDAFLPEIIRDAVQLKGRQNKAFSKYAACRMYG